MDSQEQILTFLQKPENLAVALEVAKHVEALRPHLHQAFWKDMHQALKTRLEKPAFADRWVVDSWGNFDQSWRNLRIRVKFLPEAFKGSFLSVCFMQGAPTNYQLYYGLYWERKDRPDPDSAAFRTLLSKSAGFSKENKSLWWPTCRDLDIFPRKDEFMRQYGLQPKEFVDGLVEQTWAYFIDIEPTLYQLNQELFEGK